MQPGQQKISQFTPVESSHPDDIIPIVRNGQNRSIKVGKFTGTPPTGWVTPAEAWSFVSYSGVTGVIRIPEGQASRYPKGTRVQFSQGTPATRRYGIVTEATTNRLTVRMIHGALENKTISQNFVSQEFSPKTPENVDWTTNALAVVKLGNQHYRNATPSNAPLEVEVANAGNIIIDKSAREFVIGKNISLVEVTANVMVEQVVHGYLYLVVNQKKIGQPRKEVIQSLISPHTGYAGAVVTGVLSVAEGDRISVTVDCNSTVRADKSNISVKSVDHLL